MATRKKAEAKKDLRLTYPVTHNGRHFNEGTVITDPDIDGAGKWEDSDVVIANLLKDGILEEFDAKAVADAKAVLENEGGTEGAEEIEIDV